MPLERKPCAEIQAPGERSGKEECNEQTQKHSAQKAQTHHHQHRMVHNKIMERYRWYVDLRRMRKLRDVPKHRTFVSSRIRKRFRTVA
jgi:hypothetical protein